MAQILSDAELLVEEVESAALHLPRDARARIAERLISSLEPADTRHDALWATEIRDRVRAFKAGELKAIPIEQALAEAEELLR